MFNTQVVPSWVSEGSIRKWHRAVAQLTRENADRVRAGQPIVEITEEALFALYTRWAGKVIGNGPSTVDENVAATEEEPLAGETEPKKKGKK